MKSSFKSNSDTFKYCTASVTLYNFVWLWEQLLSCNFYLEWQNLLITHVISHRFSVQHAAGNGVFQQGRQSAQHVGVLGGVVLLVAAEHPRAGEVGRGAVAGRRHMQLRALAVVLPLARELLVLEPVHVAFS